MINDTVSRLMLLAPWPLLGAGIFVGVGADRHARVMRKATTGAAWFAFLCAILAAVAYGLGGIQSETFFRVALPAGLGAGAISAYYYQRDHQFLFERNHRSGHRDHWWLARSAGPSL